MGIAHYRRDAPKRALSEVCPTRPTLWKAYTLRRRFAKSRCGTAPRNSSPHGEGFTIARSAAPAASHAGVILAYALPVSTLAWRPHWALARRGTRSEEHTSELQSHSDLVCRL